MLPLFFYVHVLQLLVPDASFQISVLGHLWSNHQNSLFLFLLITCLFLFALLSRHKKMRFLYHIILSSLFFFFFPIHTILCFSLMDQFETGCFWIITGCILLLWIFSLWGGVHMFARHCILGVPKAWGLAFLGFDQWFHTWRSGWPGCPAISVVIMTTLHSHVHGIPNSWFWLRVVEEPRYSSNG